MSGNLFEDGYWLLPPNYVNNDCKNTASPKSPIKEEPKTGEQSTSQMQRNVHGDQIVPSAKSGKGGLGWQTPKPTSEASTPARNTKTPSKTFSKAPRYTEVYPRNTNW